MRYRILAALAATAVAGVIGAAAAPAYAATDPAPETRTVTTHVVDRVDNGHGTPPAWALDTFDRIVEITGGPVYVIPGVEDESVPAMIAETKQEKPELTLCDLVKYLHLKWTYHAVVKDAGTFVTTGGETSSPNEGVALADDVPGTFSGSFTADFEAAAHWCTFDASDLDGKTTEGNDAPKTSQWVSSLFGEEFKGSSINEDWTWTYKTCVESWWDAADKASNDGTTDAAGDITGLPCPTPSPTPSVTTATVVANAPQLPVTGGKLTGLIAAGIGLLVLGGAAVVLGRRRRTS